MSSTIAVKLRGIATRVRTSKQELPTLPLFSFIAIPLCSIKVQTRQITATHKIAVAVHNERSTFLWGHDLRQAAYLNQKRGAQIQISDTEGLGL